jgi:transglutaminase-like putative cysteine protease
MPTDFAFRFSTYLTLALACMCLGYAEWDYLPEVTVFTGLVAIALVAAFRAEWRFALSLTAANWVGAAIFFVAIGWIAFHWRDEFSLIHTLPWPAGLLPYLGPVVLTLIVAKLFRPKHVGDWWAMHGMGLAAVALASSLTDDATFIVLFLAYVLIGVWSLTLFYQRRAAGLIPPVPPADASAGPFDIGAWFPFMSGNGESAPVVAGPPPDRNRPAVGRFSRSHARKALGWVAIAGVVALPLFFATPRSTGTYWQLRQSRMETGYAPDSAVDLTRTGELETSQEMALEVKATDRNGLPFNDLPSDLRWRGRGYVDYDNGRWVRFVPRRLAASDPRGAPDGPSDGRLPDLGPDQVILEYRLNPKVRGGVVLADPTVYDPQLPGPWTYKFAEKLWTPTMAWDGSYALYPGNSRIVEYKQAFRILANPALSLPFELAPGAEMTTLPRLTAVSSQNIVQFSRRLLDRLIADGKLAPDVESRRREYEPLTLAIAPQDRRAVAKAFCDYLANSGEYVYSLTLTRHNKLIDPIEDFLLHNKTGHCERFATALVLMLRAVGIPSQFVLGYKGCDLVDEGTYYVRMEHAHAWVEALVPADATGQKWQWLSLDPTPLAEDDLPSVGVISLWDAARQTGRRIFSNYIIGLTPETQRHLSQAAQNTVATHGGSVAAGIGALGGLVVLTGLVRRRLHRRPPIAPPSDAAPWFTRLVRILEPHGLPLSPGLTPQEYARQASASLQAKPATAAWADLPVQVANALYEARYAGRPLDAERITAIERAIDTLADALAKPTA